ncbi:MAG TPA: hypothetical protein VE968_07380 [Sphingomicrobium sp.]|nr:hypothetical protein [Sphingomicrobium sp.]
MSWRRLKPDDRFCRQRWSEAAHVLLELRDPVGLAQRPDLVQKDRRLQRRLASTPEPIDEVLLVRLEFGWPRTSWTAAPVVFAPQDSPDGVACDADLARDLPDSLALSMQDLDLHLKLLR